MEITVDKYLIINDKREALVFIHEGRVFEDVFLPRIIYGDEENVPFQQKIMSVLKDVVGEENETFLYEQATFDHRLIDGEEITCKKNKRYYVCLSDFNDELVGKINEVCSNYNIMPVLLPISFIKKSSMRYLGLPKSRRKLNIDIDLPKPIKILEYKLDYVEY